MLQRLMGGGRSGAKRPAPGTLSRSYVGVNSGDTDYNTSAKVAAIIQANTANTSAFTKIWEMKVPAGQMIAWGYGSASQPRNQGLCYFAAVDIGTDFEEGTLRILVANARETRVNFVAEMDSRVLHTATATTLVTAQPTGYDELQPFSFSGMWVKEDSFLQLAWKTHTPGTTIDGVTFSFPVTVLQ